MPDQAYVNIPSDVPHVVTGINGTAATNLERLHDGEGTISVLLRDGSTHVAVGEVSVEPDGQSARLYEKEKPGGKDTRVWQISINSQKQVVAAVRGHH